MKRFAITSVAGHKLQTFQACTERTYSVCLGYSRSRHIVTNLLSCALEAYLLTYLPCQVITDYWLNVRFRRRGIHVVTRSFGVNSLTQDHGIWPQETRNISLYSVLKTCFDILNRLGVAHECDEQTDRRTGRTAVSNSAI